MMHARLCAAARSGKELTGAVLLVTATHLEEEVGHEHRVEEAHARHKPPDGGVRPDEQRVLQTGGRGGHAEKESGWQPLQAKHLQAKLADAPAGALRRRSAQR